MAAYTKRNIISTSFGNVFVGSHCASISSSVFILKQSVFRFLRCVFFRFL